MKTFITTLFLAASLAASAQVNQRAVIVGGSLTAEVKDGLLGAYLATGPNQVALVAGQGVTSVYYLIYNAHGQPVSSGKFTKRTAGEYQVIDLGANADGCKTRFSAKPLFVSSKAHNNG